MNGAPPNPNGRFRKTKSNKYNDDYVEDPDRYLFEQ